jgi:hypothetical protein
MRSIVICTLHEILDYYVIKSRALRNTEHVTRMGKMRMRKYFGRKDFGERLLGIPRHRYENSIKVDFKQIMCECVAQDRD